MKAKSVDARGLAAAWLDQVLTKRRPLDEVVDAEPGDREMTARDRAFAVLLCLTVLRRLGQIDDLIDRCLERPLPGRARGARVALRLGAAQLLFLETPAHAAVDTSVNLAVARGAGAYRKLVNAVLRRLGRDGAAWRDSQDAARLTTTDWLWESWTAAYGEAAARAIAKAHLRDPPLDITAKGDPALLADKLEAAPLPSGSLRRVVGGRVDELPGFETGDWWVQDAAAALPARLLKVETGSTVIDLCAAPGGKTAQLAAAGARVIAVDRSPGRLARLRQNLDRLQLSAEVVEADAAAWRPDKPVSFVLIDAPCTATGTIRRHPDIAHLKSAEDVARATAAQDRLLANAAGMLAPDGVLVYAVCSLQPEEGADRIDAFLNKNRVFVRVPIHASEIGGLEEAITPVGDLRTLPSHLADQGGMDGFYAARLKRVS